MNCHTRSVTKGYKKRRRRRFQQNDGWSWGRLHRLEPGHQEDQGLQEDPTSQDNPGRQEDPTSQEDPVRQEYLEQGRQGENKSLQPSTTSIGTFARRIIISKLDFRTQVNFTQLPSS